MNQPVQSWGRFGSTTVSAQQRNRVLRNTYWLLALSMLPTVLGAWVGVATGITASLGGVTGLVVFLAGAFGFMYAIHKTKDSALGVPLLLAFTFFMGLMLSRILQVALGFSNGASIIAMAAGGTGAIFFVLAGIASTTKRNFSGLGKFLFAGAILILLAALANAFFQIPALALTISALVVAIFSAFILYDINRIVRGGEDNYITATLGVYLSVYNVFVGLVHLLLVFTGQRE